MKDILDKIEAEVPNGVCCCCGHKLAIHIDEGDGYRCHSLAQDFYQCECYLRKRRYDEGLEAYDLKKRLKQQITELPKKKNRLSTGEANTNGGDDHKPVNL